MVFVLGLLSIKISIILFFPLRALAMTPWLIDDSFIFMTIAHNLATGAGYTLDGQLATSGAPLLWTFLSSINHLLLDSLWAAKATIIVSVVLGGMCTILVFYLASRLFDRRVGWIALSWCSLSAPLFFNSLNGMETALFTFLGLSAVVLYLERDRWAPGRGSAAPLIIGAILGLANLARADGIFLCFGIGMNELWLLFHDNEKKRSERLRWIFLLGLAAAMFTLPSVLWSWHANEMLAPANQQGRRWLSWENVIDLHGSVHWGLYGLKVLKNMMLYLVLMSICIGLPLWGECSLWKRLRDRPASDAARITFLYLFSYVGALIFYQGYFPDFHGLRYLNLGAHLIIPFAAWNLWRTAQLARHPFNLKIPCLMVAVFLLSTFVQYHWLMHRMSWANGMRLIPFYRTQTVDRWWAQIDWINTHLPARTAIAVKDFGRLSYFTDVRVVELAGIIDPELISHLQEGTIADYMNDRGVEYVIGPPDGEWPVFEQIRRNCRLVPVDEAPFQECTSYSLQKWVD